MGVQFFLGYPPAHIKQWIIDHTAHGFWEQIVKNLETEPSQEKRNITSTDELVAGVLPSVGSTIPVDYKIDVNGDAVATEWMILGYNQSIPSRVKYLNGNNAVYVATTSGGLLAQIAAGTSAYADKTTETSSGTVASVGSGTFVYGNNCTYTVPTTVTVGGVEYTFAGYNMTIQSRYILAAEDGGTLYYYPTFDEENQSNAWSTSKLRSWMNGNAVVSNQTWHDSGQNSTSTSITGLISRLTDTTFTGAVIPTVNRTWVHSSWTGGKTLDTNQCEHVVDRFWALGVGNVNCRGTNTSSRYPDGGASVDGENKGYDTSRFSVFTESDVFASNSSRVRNLMSVDGGDSSSASYWWLRSAYSDYDGLAGYVCDGGYVDYYYVDGGNGCLPACTIG